MNALYLIPMPINTAGNYDNISREIREHIVKMDLIIAERARTFRRFASQLLPELDISTLNVFELDKHNPWSKSLFDSLKAHTHVGVVSEAGCPGIADPGNFLVQYAHQHHIRVEALSGPSSIFLALMASGFNGQHFSFHGYLPRKENHLAEKLRHIHRELDKTHYSQIFMETPYRNQRLLDSICQTLPSHTQLHITCDATHPSSFSKTQSLFEWKQSADYEIDKRPCIFILGHYGNF